MKFHAIQASPLDNVATLIYDAKTGNQIKIRNGNEINLMEVRGNIPYGHKISLSELVAGTPIIKFGECIGAAKQDIEAGVLVHVHNVESQRGRGDIGGVTGENV